MNVDDEKFPARQVSWFIAAAKDEGKRPGQVEIFDDFSRKYAEIYRYYDELCQKEGTVDFAELLLRSFELMSRNESIRTHYQNRFRHVLVDEFQDTNRLQYRWLKLLCGPETAMFAVGDDDQSIYRFRGANVGNMGDFERDFRVKNLIRLEQNYRSYGNILNAANALISNNTKRLGKNLWTESGEGEPIRIFEAGSDGLEAAWVVEEIQALVRDGLARRDIALLYRSNAQSRILEHALFSQGISYRVYGGLRFFERQEVKHALAYLRLIANPDDDAAFLRVVNFPTRGIGARSIEQLQDTAGVAGTSLWQATSKVAGKAGTVLGTFVRLIEKLRADTANRPLPEVVEQLLEASGLVAHYRTERDGADRVENLNELVNAAAAFMHEEGLNREPAFNVEGTEGPVEPSEQSAAGDVVPIQADAVQATPDDPLSAFLAHAALESGDNQAGEGSDAVQLMTVHSAKGLEFHVVFVTGLEEGLFPHDQSSSEEDGLEEERRLMYVAITRARTRLYLSFAQTRMLHGQTRYGVASRFVDELPKGVLKWLTQQRGRHLDDRAWASAGPPAGFKPRETAPGSPYRIGQSVKHAKFGEGVIVNAEGAGGDAKLQINFGPSGVKWLALEYAKLEAS